MKKIMYMLGLAIALTTVSVSGFSQTKVVDRKGMSNGAKGAIVGGAGGALAGAAVSKDHSKGAIIGGVAGAGAGYLIGHHKDKKYGRKRVHKVKSTR